LKQRAEEVTDKQQAVALTDEQILKMFAQAVGNVNEDEKYVEVYPDEVIEFSRALLAAAQGGAQ